MEGTDLLLAAGRVTGDDDALPVSAPLASKSSYFTVAVAPTSTPALTMVAVAITEALLALAPSAGVEDATIALGLTLLRAYTPSVSMWTGGALCRKVFR